MPLGTRKIPLKTKTDRWLAEEFIRGRITKEMDSYWQQVLSDIIFDTVTDFQIGLENLFTQTKVDLKRMEE